MQQYFTDEILDVNKVFSLAKDDIYHLRKVLRKDNKYIFRVCDSNHHLYLCHLLDDDSCISIEFLDENNELEVDITAIISLIKNDKLELILQKITELGIKRIVLFQAKRSVVILKDEKKLNRYHKIIKEASEQSHRNMIPELSYVDNIKDLSSYMSNTNIICYEKAENINSIDINKSITYIIGPEGGFEEVEYRNIVDLGFNEISLGKRILRAETAAIYMSSVIVSKCQ